jgi:hypothetical protein
MQDQQLPGAYLAADGKLSLRQLGGRQYCEKEWKGDTDHLFERSISMRKVT